MNLIEKIRLIERVDGLISRESTGSPAALAQRLHISERNTYNLIKVMKEMGASIYFCKTRNSYCYKEEGQFKFGFMVKESSCTGGERNFFKPLQHLQITCSTPSYIC